MSLLDNIKSIDDNIKSVDYKSGPGSDGPFMQPDWYLYITFEDGVTIIVDWYVCCHYPGLHLSSLVEDKDKYKDLITKLNEILVKKIDR